MRSPRAPSSPVSDERPRRPAGERLPPAERRAKLLRAFRDEALAAGAIAGVGIRAVVERAGCTAPVLYRLFGDRAGLVQAAVRSTHTSMLARLEAAARPGGGSCAERIRRLGLAYIARGAGPDDEFEALVNVACGNEPELAAIVRDVFGRFEQLLAALVREGIAAGEFAAATDPEYVAWRLIDLGLFRNQAHLMRLERPDALRYEARALDSLLAEIAA